MAASLQLLRAPAVLPSPEAREGPRSRPGRTLTAPGRSGFSVFSGISLRTVRLVCHLLVASLINSTVIPISAALFPVQVAKAAVVTLLLGAGKGRYGEASSLG